MHKHEFDPSNLKKLLEETSISFKKLEEATGIKMTAFRYYLEGKATPTFDALIAFADYFAVPLDFIAGRCDEETANGILRDYSKRFMELRRAPFEAYLIGRRPEGGTTYGDGKMEAPWPYNLLDAVFKGSDASVDEDACAIVDAAHEADIISVLDVLTPREKLAVLSYYRDGMTLEKISKTPEFGNVHREMVRQVLVRALKKLRVPSRVKILRYGYTSAEREGEIKKRERELEQVKHELDTYEVKLEAWKTELDEKARILEKEARNLDKTARLVADQWKNPELLQKLDEVPTTLLPLYGVQVRDMNLSLRPYNGLMRAGVSTLGAVISSIESGALSKIPNLGPKSVQEILLKVRELTGKEYDI